MANKLKETNWNEVLASEDVNTFSAKLKNIFNTTCPVTVSKQKLGRKMPDKPWLPNSLKQACKKKNLLNKKLDHYGIRGLANKWICSYLMNRSQYFSINDTSSESLKVTCGVPQ